MTLAAVALVCVCGALGLGALGGAAPEYDGPALLTCTRDDPLVNDCLKVSLQAAMRSFADGYPPFGMVTLDPLLIQALTLVSPEGAKCDLINYNVYGIRNVITDQVIFSETGEDTFQLSFALRLAQFDSVGTYKMEQGFLGNKKPNQGSFSMNVTDYRADFVLDGALATGEDGQQYATLKGLSSSFNGGTGAKVNFENLSPGRNRLWNKQPAGLLRAYKTGIDQLHPILAQTYANLLFQKVPFNDLFPASKHDT